MVSNQDDFTTPFEDNLPKQLDKYLQKFYTETRRQFLQKSRLLQFGNHLSVILPGRNLQQKL